LTPSLALFKSRLGGNRWLGFNDACGVSHESDFPFSTFPYSLEQQVIITGYNAASPTVTSDIPESPSSKSEVVCI
jgi:hypothetical protein